MHQRAKRYIQKLLCSIRGLRASRLFAWLWALPLLAVFLFGASLLRPASTSLQQVFDKGTLVVVTRHDPAAFYTDHHGDTGFDYELARRFATSLGVKLKVIQATSIPELYHLLADGQADIAAAALSPSQQAPASIAFSQPLMATGQRFVYRLGEAHANNVADLKGHSVAVLAGSRAAATMQQLASHYGDIIVDRVSEADSASLLRRVSAGKADYALINNQSFELQHPLFPDLNTAFVAGKEHFAWALSQPTDTSLLHAVNRFIKQAIDNGTVQTLAAQFYSEHNAFNLYAARVFMTRINKRLPTYSASFYQAGRHNGFDWRLLAAMAYQESHWDPDAVSPTGVRGMMMLTLSTAQQLGVDRTNPLDSIKGGARYLRQLEKRLPDHIQQPNRTWMALAAYNIGMGHLEDARVLTQSQGGDPDSWNDVRQRLLLLDKAAYGKYLRHGSADGPQAVAYVGRIRHYYKLLVWAQSLADEATQLAMAN